MACATLSGALVSTAAMAQAKEQFFPSLVYRTGAYAPNGVPFANGYADYLKLTNARGGINGVQVSFEECETGYATDRGVECYERLKGKNGGATVFQPLSTGITFALTEKAPVDKIPLITAGYGRSESADGGVFKWNFPIAGTYWVAADVIIQHLGKKEGGLDKLKGKKIALVYHDSPFGKEPIPLLQERAAMHGFQLSLLPVTHPGVEQKSTWLQIRRDRPDYVINWGWGVMNSTLVKEAQATGYPRDKIYGVWWAGAEPDVKDVGMGAKGYNAITMQHGTEKGSAVAKEILAALGFEQVGDGAQRGGFACSVATQHSRNFALGHVERDALEHQDHVVVDDLDAIDVENGFGGFHVLFPLTNRQGCGAALSVGGPCGPRPAHGWAGQGSCQDWQSDGARRVSFLSAA